MNTVLTKTDKPFTTEAAAARAMKAAGIHSEVVEIDGGYGYRNVRGAGVPDAGRPCQGQTVGDRQGLFHAGLKSCLTRRYQDHQLASLSEVSSDPNYLEAPVTVFNTLACRTQSIIGGGQFGEDIDVPKYAQNDVMFMLESIFQAAVGRVCSAEAGWRTSSAVPCTSWLTNTATTSHGGRTRCPTMLRITSTPGYAQ